VQHTRYQKRKEGENTVRIFDLQNPFWNFIGKLVDAVWLNLIFVVFSLPIFTIGASTTAMFSVTLKMARDREGYVFRGFWKAFKENFKQATLIWLGILVAGIILATDIQYFYSQDSLFARLALFLMIGIVVLLFTMMIYIFPLLAQFDNSIKQTVKNSLLIAIRHLPWTVLFILIYALLALGIWLMFEFMVLFIFGIAAFLLSYIYSKIFIRYIPEELRNDY
jgi:uncharacterized membrane protein YesL